MMRAPLQFMGLRMGTRIGPFLKVTIYEFQRGILYSKGRFERVLEPGRYWLRAGDAYVQTVDIRPAFATIPGQEVLSADGVALKMSLAARYEIADLRTAFVETQDVFTAFYLTLQIALREIVGQAKVEDLLAERQRFGERLMEIAAEPVAALGLRLLAADVKDVMFPGELKKIFAQVVQARQEGLAALEKARGESAALRNLANAARLAEGNPALIQLRMLQAVAAQPGNTVVLAMPQGPPQAERTAPREAE
jgi:regulator of protease activity HflC (stomatin/prohibitin superfamily)